MTKIVSVIKSLPELLALKPATKQQIVDVERELGTSFSKEYQEYLSTFGAIMADGIELTGIAKSEHRNVVSVTKKEREMNAKVPLSLYVLENTHIDGLIIWQDEKGVVYRTEPDSEPMKIADSMEEYLSARMK